MRLALQTDFALRTLMYLGWRGERATTAEVAGFFGISAAHVAKVVNQLARLGFVRSIRGIGGGIELARPSDKITLGEVITAFEGALHLLDCVATEGVSNLGLPLGRRPPLSPVYSKQPVYKQFSLVCLNNQKSKRIVNNEKNKYAPPAIDTADSWNACGLLNWSSIKNFGLYLFSINKKYL